MKDVLIEAELLFRSASFHYEDGKLRQAVQLLDEALKLDMERKYRYLFCKAICLAKIGEIAESIEVFRFLKDDFHVKALTFLLDAGQAEPKKIPHDVPFEKGMLISFWERMIKGEEVDCASKALNSMAKAYILFSHDQDPEPPLKLLEGATGVESLVLYLLLLFAIYRRRNIRARNIIKSDPSSFRQHESLKYLLDIHLMLLLREGLYNEIGALEGIFNGLGIETEMLKDILDELSFHRGLKEIGENRLEKALDHFLRIRKPTPAVIHNIALLYQKLERYSEANDYCIRILRSEKKPKKSDSEDVKIAYASTAKYIAQNYLRDDEPREALPYLKDVLTLLKDDREAIEAMQAVSSELGNNREALQYARRLYEMEPENQEYLINYIMELSQQRDLEALVPLYEKALGKDPNSPFMSEGLYFSCVLRALELRSDQPEEARGLMKKVSHKSEDDALLTYLEAFFLRKEGKAKRAGQAIKKAVGSADTHLTEYQLAKCLFEDGLIDPALELFSSITSCGCSLSDSLFENSIGFLAEKEDWGNAERICDLAISRKGYDLHSIADIMMSYGKPSWALPYSQRLAQDRSADEEDRFMHLLVLNEMGNGYKTLQYADSLYQRALEEDDSESAGLYKYLIKQIRSRGRFKRPHE